MLQSRKTTQHTTKAERFGGKSSFFYKKIRLKKKKVCRATQFGQKCSDYISI